MLLGQTADKRHAAQPGVRPRRLVDRPDGRAGRATKLADWAKLGYFPPTANGDKYNDSAGSVRQGRRAVFLIGGTWFAADLQKKMGDKVGFMLPLPASVGGAIVPDARRRGLPFAITSKSKHPDVAAAYLELHDHAARDGRASPRPASSPR